MTYEELLCKVNKVVDDGDSKGVDSLKCKINESFLQGDIRYQDVVHLNNLLELVMA